MKDWIIAFLSLMVIFLFTWLTMERIWADTQLRLSDSLQMVLQTTRESLVDWRQKWRADALTLAASPLVVKAIEAQLQVSRDHSVVLQEQPAQEILDGRLRPVLQEQGYLGYIVLDPQYRNIASLLKDNVGEANLLAAQGDLLERVFSGETIITLPQLSDLPLPGADGNLAEGEPTLFAVSPVHEDSGNIIAALALRIDFRQTFSRILKLSRIGDTGETYAVSSSGKFLSESRFNPHLRQIGLIGHGKRSILAVNIRDPGGNLMEGYRPVVSPEERPLTIMAASVTAGQSGSNLEGYRDYRGVPVVGAWIWDSKLDFGLATEMDVNEAYASFHHTRRLVLTLVTSITALLAGFMLVQMQGRHKSQAHAQKIHEKNMYLRLVLQNTVEGIITIDQHGIVISVNKAAERVFGYSKDELIGQNISLLMPEPYKSEHDGYIQRYLKTGEARIIGFGREVAGKHKDGSTFPLSVAVGEIWIGGERFFVGTVRDLTEEKKVRALTEEKKAEAIRHWAEKQVMLSEKLASIGQFAAGVCHEILNPVNNISLHSEMLVRKKGEVPEISRYTEKVQDEIQRITKIINSLTTFSRKGTRERVVVDIHELIQSVLSLVEENFAAQGIEIHKTFDNRIPRLFLDKDQFRQVFFNLFNNARHAMPKGGSLVIETRQWIDDAPWTQIKVTDTGCGIPKEHLVKIFEPFFTTKPEGEGTGIGLSVVYGIVEEHGGTIQVQSEEGQGTCFTLILPNDHLERTS